MTIWAAKAAFQEDELGSLEVGKSADFVVLNQDLMKIEENKISETKVLETFSSGKKVH
jgi:predicted amidohydrolase YtcJ